jgi:hypothetical protein
MTIDVERWRAVVAASPSRRAARDALGCTFNALKAFRAEHMPDHAWPNSKTGEDVAADKHLQRIKKRAAAGKGPAPDEVETAIGKLTARQRKVMAEFMPGTRNRELATEYAELAEMRLLQGVMRAPPMKMAVWVDGYGYTDLGRAVQARLKADAGKAP